MDFEKNPHGDEMKKRYRGVLFGLLAAFAVSMMGYHSPVYAAALDQYVNGAQEGDNGGQAEGDFDVDINLQDRESQKETASSAYHGSSAASSKIPTNNVGTGLNDQVSKNAKTGDILNGKNLMILLFAAGGILIIVGMQRRKDHS